MEDRAIFHDLYKENIHETYPDIALLLSIGITIVSNAATT